MLSINLLDLTHGRVKPRRLRARAALVTVLRLAVLDMAPAILLPPPLPAVLQALASRLPLTADDQ